MKNKQEVIAIIATWICCGDDPDKSALFEAETLYDRIAPLVVREFPDEALRDLLLDVDLWKPEALFWRIKCLIEGQEEETTDDTVSAITRGLQDKRTTKRTHMSSFNHTRGDTREPPKGTYGDGTKTPSLQLRVEKKGTCTMCGGSGRDMLEKCPACKGTGLRRSGVDRRIGKGRRGYDAVYETFDDSPYSRRSENRRKVGPG